MNKNKIFGFVAMGAALILIISVFLPYISMFSISSSLWKAEDPSRVLMILLGLFVIVLYLINKKTEMSYITAGFGTFYSIAMIISAEGLEYFAIGFYLMILSSLTIGVMTFLYDESKSSSIINLSVNKNNQPVNTNQPSMQQQQNIAQPVVNQPEEPQQTITGYDPNTGNPIYSNQNNN